MYISGLKRVFRAKVIVVQKLPILTNNLLLRQLSEVDIKSSPP